MLLYLARRFTRRVFFHQNLLHDYLLYLFGILYSLPVPMLAGGLLHSPKDRHLCLRYRQVQAGKHGGAGRYKWRRIAISFPPRIVVRGGNPISFVSILLRLRPELLIKL
jgi:hypothetical protein